MTKPLAVITGASSGIGEATAKAFSNVPQGNNGTSTGANATCSFLFDVTNTTTHKASFTTEVTVSSTQTTGDDGVNNTHVTFMRLGDT